MEILDILDQTLNGISIGLTTFIKSVYALLKSPNAWSGVIGAILGAAPAWYTGHVKNKREQIYNYNNVLAYLVAIIEGLCAIKKQFVIPVMRELKDAHESRERALKNNSKQVRLVCHAYLNKFPETNLSLSEINPIALRIFGKHPNLMRTLYRLDEALKNLNHTLANRNVYIDQFNIYTNPPKDASEAIKRFERIFGFNNGAGSADLLLKSMSESLQYYVDDGIAFADFALRNIKVVANDEMSRSQRKQVLFWELDPDMEWLLPPKDYLKDVLDRLKII